MESDEEYNDIEFDLFIQGIQNFRTKWNTMNKRCKMLEASLAETNTKKKQLEEELRLTREYAKEVRKEKEELADVVRGLYQDLKNNSLHGWINTLAQKISSRNEVNQNIVPVSNNSNDENDFCSDPLVNRTPVTSFPNDTSDHNYNFSPTVKKINLENMGKVNQFSNVESNTSSNELSNENRSKGDTITNESKIISEHPMEQDESFDVEISEPVEQEIEYVSRDLPIDANENSQDRSQCDINGMNNENSFVNQTVPTKPETANGDLNSSVDTITLSQHSPETRVDNECESSTNEDESNGDKISSKKENGNHQVDSHDFSIDNKALSKFLSHRNVSIRYECPPREESNSSEDFIIDLPTSAKSSQDLYAQCREASDEYFCDSSVSFIDTASKSSQHILQCSNESVLQGNVNHEEIFLIEESQLVLLRYYF